MKILVLADRKSKYLYDFYEPDKLKDVDLIISCGDLPASYLSFLSPSVMCLCSMSEAIMMINMRLRRRKAVSVLKMISTCIRESVSWDLEDPWSISPKRTTSIRSRR